MHLSRLTDALRRARAAKDVQTRDVWVREAWRLFWEPLGALRRYGPCSCIVVNCERVALYGLSCARCDAFLRGALGEVAPLWWVLVPSLDDAFQAGRDELRAAVAAGDVNG